MSPRHSPPRAAIRLLETFLPEDTREAVIGDLVESHDDLARTRPVAAYVRFWREAISAVVELQVTPNSVSAFTPYTRESLMQSFVGDIRHAIRVLFRARGFAGLCLLTLGIAIGATAAIFSVVNPVLLRPLPFPAPERIVTIYERERDGAASFTGFATIADMKREAKTLQYGAAVGDWQPTLFGDRDAERMQGQRVSWEYFRVLGVHPAIGRDFLATDDTPDNNNVVILGHGLWVRRFGADPGVVGKPVNIDGISRVVIGVMPASFDNVLDPTAQIWRVLGYASQPWTCRTCRHLQFVGRIRPNVSRDEAARELDGIFRRIVAANPKDYSTRGALIVGMQEQVTRAARPILLAIFGAVALVLLIGIANVVNLQLARAVRREEEFAVRAALGAGRKRIAQQLLAEGLVLAVVGGIAGIAIAAAMLPALVAQLPEALPRLQAIHLDWQVLALVGLLVLAVGVAVGTAPAIQMGGRRLFDVLRGGGRGGALGVAHHRTRMGLVIGEIALALMLMLGAALLGRSLIRLLAVDVGFDATHLVTMQVQATGTAYPTPASVFANHDRVRDAVRAIPGVVDVGLTTQLPLSGFHDQFGIAAQDKPLENPELAPSADRYTVTADFMRTMRIPILRGRGFTEAEARDSNVKVAIVSDALARRIWPGENALGKYVRLGGPTRAWREVIGIAGNIRHTGLDETISQQVYVPERQWFNEESQMVLAVRTRGDPARMVSAIHEAVRSVDPLQPITAIATMETLITRSTSQRRLGLLLFMTFSIIALLLASAGIYGVLAGAVAERTREFGLRTALGATPRSIVGLVVSEGVKLAGIGLLVGGASAVVLTRYLRTLLFGVQTTDPIALSVSVLTIVAVSLAACLVPAARAVRIDPMTALRSD